MRAFAGRIPELRFISWGTFVTFRWYSAVLFQLGRSTAGRFGARTLLASHSIHQVERNLRLARAGIGGMPRCSFPAQGSC
jgi:hypothetical protein